MENAKVIDERVITKKDFKDAARKSGYWKKRWPYYNKTIENINGLEFKNSLELGSGSLCVVKTSDTMDLPDQHYKCGVANGLTFNHDATITPWPIEDKAYDLFIALQVWEHLDGNQAKAFEEVQRISKMAYLSFPYEWKTRDRVHRNITRERINKWTCGVEPTKSEIVSNGTKYKQAHYLWIFS